ncbi:hypothetical protein BGS_1316 [Beggiatoa sp. SS]|nr:hypothetical protein BGS_1316 [Beggiatoa sp. SS]
MLKQFGVLGWWFQANGFGLRVLRCDNLQRIYRKINAKDAKGRYNAGDGLDISSWELVNQTHMRQHFIDKID